MLNCIRFFLRMIIFSVRALFPNVYIKQFWLRVVLYFGATVLYRRLTRSQSNPGIGAEIIVGILGWCPLRCIRNPLIECVSQESGFPETCSYGPCMCWEFFSQTDIWSTLTKQRDARSILFSGSPAWAFSLSLPPPFLFFSLILSCICTRAHVSITRWRVITPVGSIACTDRPVHITVRSRAPACPWN